MPTTLSDYLVIGAVLSAIVAMSGVTWAGTGTAGSWERRLLIGSIVLTVLLAVAARVVKN